MSSSSSSSAAARTPVPVGKIAVLGLTLSVNNMGIYMIFSFLPFMVKFYYPEIDVRDIGQKAGFLGSAFSVGSILGNFLWGYVSDVWGRRPALLCGLAGTCVSVMCFAVAPNFALAVLARLAWGLLNGNVGVSKTYLGEVLDDSNSLRGTSYYGVVGGVGRTLGPLLGGLLADPALTLPALAPPGSFLAKHPFALPCIGLLIYTGIVLVLAFFFLPESRPPPLRAAPSSSDQAEYEREEEEIKTEDPHYARRVRFMNTVTVKHIDAEGRSGFAFASLNSSSRPSHPAPTAGLIAVLEQQEVAVIVIIYGLVSWMQVVGAEVFPLWVVTDRAFGGFAFTAADIGIIVMISGPVIVLSQLLVYPRVAEARGALDTLRISLCAHAAIAVLFPVINNLPGAQDDFICRVCLTICLSALNVVMLWMMVTIFTLINNAAPSGTLATVNAIGQTCASIGRATGPYMGASLFAWTERNGHGWPFNYALVWYMIAAVSLLVLKLATSLPSTMEKRKAVDTYTANEEAEDAPLLPTQQDDKVP